jgi:TRAP-type C4-dicarboxylate transport system permease small subunit
MKLIYFIDEWIEKISKILIVISLLAILFLSTLGILSRWLHIHIQWIDSFVRHLVFLSMFAGGVIATSRSSHIGIDLASKILEIKSSAFLRINVYRFITLFSSLILLWLSKAGLNFAFIEWEFSKIEFLGIHSGQLVSIIPVGLFCISFKFFKMFVESFKKDFVLPKSHTSEGSD